jgi:hypothetical protein
LCLTCSGPEPEHFLWSADPQSLSNPFPDARLLTLTGAQLRPDYYRPFLMSAALTNSTKALFTRYAQAASTEVHGFGNFSPTLLLTSSPIDPTSLSGHFARLLKTGSGYQVLERDVPVEHSTTTLDGTGKSPGDGFPEFTLVRPSVPLPEGAQGLLVVLKGVKTKGGEPLGRGREWGGQRLDLAAAALALQVSESDIVLALDLKAAPVSASYRALLAWVDRPEGLAGLTIPIKGMGTDGPVGTWLSTDPDWSVMLAYLQSTSWGASVTHVDRVVVGELAARDPRDGGVWSDEWVLNPSLAPVVPLRFVLSVPKGSKPPSGWPTVIVAHGVGGRNVPVSGSTESYCLDLAEYLAAAGIAAVGIDAPSHGTRGSFVEFFDIENVPVMRENFREMSFDLMQLARALPTIDVDSDGTPDLDPSLGFFGNSLGAIMGSSYVALDDRVKYALLNVPGGGLSNILVSKNNHDLIGLLFASKTSITFDSVEYHSAFPIIRAVSQPFLEPADSINLFPLMSSERAALMQMGLGDQTIPNFTSLDLAHSGGLSEPSTSSSGTSPVRALYRVDPQAYGKPVDYNGHNVFNDLAAPRKQAIDFLSSKGTTFTVP